MNVSKLQHGKRNLKTLIQQKATKNLKKKLQRYALSIFQRKCSKEKLGYQKKGKSF